MERLLRFALVGALASLVDGALGMGYGVTSATILLSTGSAPLAASASIHLAELGATLVAGISHHVYGNVDWRIVRAIALPGAIGGFGGAVFLTSVDGDTVKPWVAGFLFVLGIVVLARFAFGRVRTVHRPPSRRRLGALGLVAGTVDAIGGGGWGPVATPSLLATGLEPRRAVGSVNAAEFAVTLAASLGFLVGLALGDIDLALVGAMLVAGMITAPFAAALVRFINPRVLGTAVGAMILLTNVRTLAHSAELSGGARTVVYGVLWTVALALVTMVARQVHIARRARRDELPTVAVTTS